MELIPTLTPAQLSAVGASLCNTCFMLYATGQELRQHTRVVNCAGLAPAVSPPAVGLVATVGGRPSGRSARGVVVPPPHPAPPDVS